MATLAKQFYCFFLVVFCTYCQTEARESKFFSKYVRLTSSKTNKNYVTVPSTNLEKDVSLPSPSPAPAPITHISNVPASAPLTGNHGRAGAPPPSYAPAPLETEENSYYGLYAKGKSDFPSDKTTTIVDDEEEEEFSGSEKPYNNRESNTYNIESSRYNTGYLSNNNGFWTSSNNKGYNNNNGYDYKSVPQGMSDTRLVNSGKYYYDVERENDDQSGQEMERENNNEEGNYYGNYHNKAGYEFDSMEEYEKQEGYADLPQEFIP